MAKFKDKFEEWNGSPCNSVEMQLDFIEKTDPNAIKFSDDRLARVKRNNHKIFIGDDNFDKLKIKALDRYIKLYNNEY